MSTIVDILSIMNMNLHNESKAIIEELASIKHMERGKLTSEYRTRTNPDGKEISLGPYYKHQAREDGKNKSRQTNWAKHIFKKRRKNGGRTKKHPDKRVIRGGRTIIKKTAWHMYVYIYILFIHLLLSVFPREIETRV